MLPWGLRVGLSSVAPMRPVTHDTVQKRWARCHVLRDDGITSHQDVTEPVFLFFFKMAKEAGQEKGLPDGASPCAEWGTR